MSALQVLLSAAAALPGQTWGSPYPTSSFITSLAYGSGRYVAASNVIAYSDDGIDWRVASVPTGYTALSVAWSGSVFVAVGSSGRIMTSPDGVGWTARTSGTANTLNWVTWSGTIFVAVGNIGTILTSPDGITWTSRTSGLTTTLYAVAWGNNRFVAGGTTSSTSPYFLYSFDGVTWQTSNRPNSNASRMYAVIWANGQFVAGGSGSTRVYTSSDGITWTARTYASGTGFGAVRSLTWDGSYYYSANDSGGTSSWLVRSADGITWTVFPPSSSIPSAARVFYENGLAVNSGVYTSANFFDWTSRSKGRDDFRTYITWLKSRFFISSGGLTKTSTDGISWTSLSFSSGIIREIGAFLFAGTSIRSGFLLPYLYSSSDGVTWTATTLPFLSGSYENPTVQTVAWSGSEYLALAYVFYDYSPYSYTYSVTWTSPDGITWTETLNAPGQTCYDLIWTGTQYVAAADNGVVCISPDGNTWTDVSLGTSGSFYSLAVSGSIVVAVGEFGRISRSTDGGTTWTYLGEFTDGARFNTVTWTGNRFFACSGGDSVYVGVVLVSSDGLSWEQFAGAPEEASSIVWNGAVYAAEGTSVGLQFSPPPVAQFL